MTREEAIKQLKGDITESCATFSNQWEKDKEAISMALASLKTDEAYQLEYENRDFVEIPKRITNGEVLCMLFPNMHYTLSDKSPRVVTTIGVASSFDVNWWNAPYQKGSE